MITMPNKEKMSKRFVKFSIILCKLLYLLTLYKYIL